MQICCQWRFEKYYCVRCELPAQITWGNVPLSNTTTTNHAAWLARERRDQPPWNTTTHSLAVGRCGGHDPKETQQRGRSITWDIGATTTNYTAWLWLITLNHHHHPQPNCGGCGRRHSPEKTRIKVSRPEFSSKISRRTDSVWILWTIPLRPSRCFFPVCSQPYRYSQYLVACNNYRTKVLSRIAICLIIICKIWRFKSDYPLWASKIPAGGPTCSCSASITRIHPSPTTRWPPHKINSKYGNILIW